MTFLILATIPTVIMSNIIISSLHFAKPFHIITFIYAINWDEIILIWIIHSFSSFEWLLMFALTWKYLSSHRGSQILVIFASGVWRLWPPDISLMFEISPFSCLLLLRLFQGRVAECMNFLDEEYDVQLEW